MTQEQQNEVPDVEQKAAKMQQDYVGSLPAFSVRNRSRADEVVKTLYGPMVYLRRNRRTQQWDLVRRPGGHIVRSASGLTELLSEPVESYLRGAQDPETAHVRARPLLRRVTMGPKRDPRMMEIVKRLIGPDAFTEPLIECRKMHYSALCSFAEYQQQQLRHYQTVVRRQAEKQALAEMKQQLEP